MKTGSLSERYLDSALLLDMGKYNKGCKPLPGVGVDFGVVNEVTSADGFGYTPSEAFYKGLNNFLVSFTIPDSMRILMVLPENTKQSHIKEFMGVFYSLSSERDIAISGGHTEISKDLSKPCFYVTFTGNKAGKLPNRKSVEPGFDIVMSGYTGTLGVNRLIEDKTDILLKRFDRSYLTKAVNKENDYQAIHDLSVLDKLSDKCLYAHDISSFGVYGALWQLGKWLGMGILVDNREIPVKQECIEICDFLDINPYTIDGTGGFLYVCEKGKDIVPLLEKENAKVIGHITNGSERLVKLTETDIRTLAPAD